MNKIDEATMETLLDKTGKGVLINTGETEEKGTLSNIRTRSITIISEMGEEITIALKKIKEISLVSTHPEILYQN